MSELPPLIAARGLVKRYGATLADAVRSVVTHRFPAERWAEAFDVARSGDCGKVILDWS